MVNNMNELEKKAELYVENILVAEDELINAAVLLHDPHETISASTGKAAAKGSRFYQWFQRFINWLMRNPEHCQEVAQKEQALGKGGVIPD